MARWEERRATLARRLGEFLRSMKDEDAALTDAEMIYLLACGIAGLSGAIRPLENGVPDEPERWQ